MGDVERAAVILIVITMNAILGTVQTIKAEQSLASLKKLSGPEAKVLRDGAVVQIPSAEVTVGDIVMLEAGDYIPADCLTAAAGIFLLQTERREAAFLPIVRQAPLSEPGRRSRSC